MTAATDCSDVVAWTASRRRRFGSVASPVLVGVCESGSAEATGLGSTTDLVACHPPMLSPRLPAFADRSFAGTEVKDLVACLGTADSELFRSFLIRSHAPFRPRLSCVDDLGMASDVEVVGMLMMSVGRHRPQPDLGFFSPALPSERLAVVFRPATDGCVVKVSSSLSLSVAAATS